MQTFLPAYTWHDSARCLDSRRLNKQKVECSQIIHAILNRGTSNNGKVRGWVNHPIVKMWSHEGLLGSDGILYLIDYTLEVCIECERRDIRDNANIYRKTFDIGNWIFNMRRNSWVKYEMPDEMKALVPYYQNLLYTKDPKFYARFKNCSYLIKPY